MSNFTDRLSKIYSNAEARPQTLLARMEMIRENPKVMAAAEQFLNGDSPMGHPIGDRCAFGAVCLKVASEIAPLKATPFAAARKMRQAMKRAGAPLLRNGKIDLNLLGEGEGGDEE